MVTVVKKNKTCQYCGHTGEDVLSYLAKVGGSDELSKIVHCSDIDACLKRITNKVLQKVD